MLIRRRAVMTAASFDDELVALDIDGGAFYAFNATAARVWELLAQPGTVDSLCAALTAEFAVEREQCEAELGLLLDEFARHGLIEGAELPGA